eukprot:GHRR01030107.1.p1 GENE.GHRR01030107.1~~GHRR01030107.1.p1  ORF type:complete len:227 (+),score=49.50 GHRR01030107.1:177-857(+)
MHLNTLKPGTLTKSVPACSATRCISSRAVKGQLGTGSSAAYCNPLGVHALVFAGDWTEASVRKVASGAAAAGYQLVEVPAFNAATLDVELTKLVFEEHGSGAACSLGLTIDADISSTDKAVVARGAAELDSALTFASSIGAKHLCGVLYSALAKYPRPPTIEGRRNCVRELKVLADKAADEGVKLCLEVVNRYLTLHPAPGSRCSSHKCGLGLSVTWAFTIECLIW